MRPVTRWLAIGLLVSLTLLLTAWVCWLTEPEAPSQVPQPSDESKLVRGTDDGHGLGVVRAGGNLYGNLAFVIWQGFDRVAVCFL